MWIRWLRFNAVGLAGVFVQLGALWLLVDAAGVAIAPATLVATELAVLHNFLLHVRWTWSDRSVSPAQTCARLVRFNLTNGAVSLSGNLIVMVLVTGWLRVPYLAANAGAIAVCAALNFLLSERLVFIPARPGRAGAPVQRPDRATVRCLRVEPSVSSSDS